MVKHWDVFAVRFEANDGKRVKDYARAHGLTVSGAIRFMTLEGLEQRGVRVAPQGRV